METNNTENLVYYITPKNFKFLKHTDLQYFHEYEKIKNIKHEYNALKQCFLNDIEDDGDLDEFAEDFMNCYPYVRDYLTIGKDSYIDIDIDSMKPIIKHLDFAFNQNHTNEHPFIGYRALSQEFLPTKVGDIFHDSCYFPLFCGKESFKDKEFKNNLATFIVPKGTRCLTVDLPSFSNVYAVLLDKNLNYKVIGKNKFLVMK